MDAGKPRINIQWEGDGRESEKGPVTDDRVWGEE